MNSIVFAGVSSLLVASWLAVYRLPFNNPARRKRMAIWLGDVSGFRPDPCFAVFATVLYLGLGCVVLLFVMLMGGMNFSYAGFEVPSVVAWLALPLAIFGTSSLNIFSVSILYRLRPEVDVPLEISRIQWISSILTLPKSFRWIVPASAALVEEVVFRGAIFGGLWHGGAQFWVASIASTTLFVVGQIVLLSTAVQVYVLGLSSLTLGTIGTLLIASTGSLVPAIVLHMSFAGFYTNMSASATSRSVTHQGANL